MSYIGKQLEVLDEHNNVIKVITVKGEREVNGVYTVTDEEGNLYTEEELNLSYVRTPECILWQAIKDNIDSAMETSDEYIQEEDVYGDFIGTFNKDFYTAVFKDFMEGMEKAGYIAKKDE